MKKIIEIFKKNEVKNLSAIKGGDNSGTGGTIEKNKVKVKGK
ncbi:hypothetical protein [Eudoraea sp.]